MTKKKILTLAMTLSMVAILAIGGTIAYFTDSEQATNTMVIGNVEINIDEWQYDTNAWEKYEDKEFVLYPLENEQGINLFNKSVRTYNTSSSQDDVYIRSIVLLEKNDVLEAAYANAGECCVPGLHFAYDNRTETYTSSYDNRIHHGSKEGGVLTDGTVTVDNNEYYVAWYVEANEQPIKYGEALSSLHSVWMDENIEQEDLKGWDADQLSDKNHDGVQVIAFSQAIQAEGLTHAEAMEALGDVTVDAVEKWVADAEKSAINDMTALAAEETPAA